MERTLKPPIQEVEIAVVGGGPAGSAVAARLAAQGRDVLLLERRLRPGWRACGVYTSPMTRRALLDLGLAAAEVSRLLRPISELRVRSLSGAECRLIHEAAGPAAGVDRVELERILLAHAQRSGARVVMASPVRSIRPTDGPRRGFELDVSYPDAPATVRARWLIGADGPRSLVARSVGASRGPRAIRRLGVTGHRHDPQALPETEPMAARLTFGRGWYCGVTPVPGRRVNVGIVATGLPARGGPDAFVRTVLDSLPGGEGEGWLAAEATDELKVSYPLANRVRRLAGTRFLLVGDAAGFVDPVTGEGLHRAFHSAELAADAVVAATSGDRTALEAYDRRLRAAYARKDAISYVFQLFMGHPGLLDYAVRRLAQRREVRSVFGQVMSDLLPPGRMLDPRFVAALLAP